MVEFFELVSSYWNESKKDWRKNRHRLYSLFAFVLIAYIVLELGSFIFTSSLNKAKTIDEIRTKFIDKRVSLGEEIIRNFYILKENTRTMILYAQKNNYNLAACKKIQDKLNVAKLESDLVISSSNMRYFYGDKITNDSNDFIHWFDKSNDNCFKNVPNAEEEVDKRILHIRQQMWRKMYPPEIVKEIHG